jgi:5-methylcytosine-specific restriction endonuclease McrA
LSTDWTPGRKKAFIISVLRGGTRRYPPKYLTLNLAKTDKKINSKTKRLAQHYLCNMCNQEHTAKDVQVDHIEPIVDPVKGFQTWDIFIDRLFCSADNLQVLCKPCHLIKTQLEKKKNKV